MHIVNKPSVSLIGKINLTLIMSVFYVSSAFESMGSESMGSRINGVRDVDLL
jgi:hypothetical protein